MSDVFLPSLPLKQKRLFPVPSPLSPPAHIRRGRDQKGQGCKAASHGYRHHRALHRICRAE